MKGKNCIITGGNSGIGYQTALALAVAGANVLIVCRNREKAETAVAQIKEKSRNNMVSYALADLSSLDAVRLLARDILKEFTTLDVLVNNAGICLSNRELTPDGNECHFAVNYLAQFLLTHELLGALNASSDGRIICVSSDSHFYGKMHFDDLSLETNYHELRAYAQSKLALVLFVYELDRRLRELGIKNISVNCVQPGLVKTDIGFKHTSPFHSLAWRIRRMGGVSPQKGAETSIFLATSPEVKGQSGKYWDKCQPKPSSGKSYDQAEASRLWEVSMSLCRIDNYFDTLL